MAQGEGENNYKFHISCFPVIYRFATNFYDTEPNFTKDDMYFPVMEFNLAGEEGKIKKTCAFTKSKKRSFVVNPSGNKEESFPVCTDKDLKSTYTSIYTSITNKYKKCFFMYLMQNAKNTQNKSAFDKEEYDIGKTLYGNLSNYTQGYWAQYFDEEISTLEQIIKYNLSISCGDFVQKYFEDVQAMQKYKDYFDGEGKVVDNILTTISIGQFLDIYSDVDTNKKQKLREYFVAKEKTYRGDRLDQLEFDTLVNKREYLNEVDLNQDRFIDYPMSDLRKIMMITLGSYTKVFNVLDISGQIIAYKGELRKADFFNSDAFVKKVLEAFQELLFQDKDMQDEVIEQINSCSEYTGEDKVELLKNINDAISKGRSNCLWGDDLLEFIKSIKAKEQQEIIKSVFDSSSNTIFELIGLYGYLCYSDDLTATFESKSPFKVATKCTGILVDLFHKIKTEFPDLWKQIESIKLNGFTIYDLLESIPTTCIHGVGNRFLMWYIHAYEAALNFKTNLQGGALTTLQDDKKDDEDMNEERKEAIQNMFKLAPILTQINFNGKPYYVAALLFNKDPHDLFSWPLKNNFHVIGWTQNPTNSIKIANIADNSIMNNNILDTMNRSTRYVIRNVIDEQQSRLSTYIRDNLNEEPLLKIIGTSLRFHSDRIKTFEVFAQYTWNQIQLLSKSSDLYLNSYFDENQYSDLFVGELHMIPRFASMIAKTPFESKKTVISHTGNYVGAIIYDKMIGIWENGECIKIVKGDATITSFDFYDDDRAVIMIVEGKMKLYYFVEIAVGEKKTIEDLAGLQEIITNIYDTILYKTNENTWNIVGNDQSFNSDQVAISITKVSYYEYNNLILFDIDNTIPKNEKQNIDNVKYHTISDTHVAYLQNESNDIIIAKQDNIQKKDTIKCNFNVVSMRFVENKLYIVGSDKESLIYDEYIQKNLGEQDTLVLTDSAVINCDHRCYFGQISINSGDVLIRGVSKDNKSYIVIGPTNAGHEFEFNSGIFVNYLIDAKYTPGKIYCLGSKGLINVINVTENEEYTSGITSDLGVSMPFKYKTIDIHPTKENVVLISTTESTTRTTFLYDINKEKTIALDYTPGVYGAAFYKPKNTEQNTEQNTYIFIYAEQSIKVYKIENQNVFDKINLKFGCKYIILEQIIDDESLYGNSIMIGNDMIASILLDKVCLRKFNGTRFDDPQIIDIGYGMWDEISVSVDLSELYVYGLYSDTLNILKKNDMGLYNDVIKCKLSFDKNDENSSASLKFVPTEKNTGYAIIHYDQNRKTEVKKYTFEKKTQIPSIKTETRSLLNDICFPFMDHVELIDEEFLQISQKTNPKPYVDKLPYVAQASSFNDDKLNLVDPYTKTIDITQFSQKAKLVSKIIDPSPIQNIFSEYHKDLKETAAHLDSYINNLTNSSHQQGIYDFVLENMANPSSKSPIEPKYELVLHCFKNVFNYDLYNGASLDPFSVLRMGVVAMIKTFIGSKTPKFNTNEIQSEYNFLSKLSVEYFKENNQDVPSTLNSDTLNKFKKILSTSKFWKFVGCKNEDIDDLDAIDYQVKCVCYNHHVLAALVITDFMTQMDKLVNCNVTKTNGTFTINSISIVNNDDLYFNVVTVLSANHNIHGGSNTIKTFRFQIKSPKAIRFFREHGYVFFTMGRVSKNSNNEIVKQAFANILQCEIKHLKMNKKGGLLRGRITEMSESILDNDLPKGTIVLWDSKMVKVDCDSYVSYKI